jgi:hypothetical protein
MATNRPRTNANPRNEPDEPGENSLTRWSKSGGLEVRIREDASDPPLAQDMENVENEAFGKKAPKKPRPRV